MSVPVRTLFFASHRELVGSAAIDVELPEGATVADLVARLRERGHPLTALPERPAVAVNRRYASLDEQLFPGDEVAFIPPVAGG